MSAEGPGRRRTVLEQVEREEFARGHIAPDADPVTPRPAATIVLARRGNEPFEVLLLQRPDTSRFAAGAYVFPGGAIDPGDAGEVALPAVPGVAGELERSALVAAVRELFEETGVLLADRSGAETADLPSVLRSVRGDLLANRVAFPELAAALGLTFDDLEVAYFARWITPARLARRYDTHFFMAVSRGEEPELTAEHTDYSWATPGEALERFHCGRLPMLYPTLKTMETLAGFKSLEAAFEAFSSRRVEPIFARLIVRGDEIRPVMPGDPDYEQGV